MSDQITVLHEAFLQCDQDRDGVLNEREFLAFCATGLQKPQSDNTMYVAMCNQFNVDPLIGIGWNDIGGMFAHVNKARSPPPRTPPPPTQEEATALSPTLHDRTSSLSYSQEDVRRVHSLQLHDRAPSVASIGDDDDLSQTSETGRPSLNFRHSRQKSSMNELELIKALQGTNEATQKKFNKKIRKLEKKLSNLENYKAKTQEELRELRHQNGVMQDTIARLQQEKQEAAERGDRLENERNLLIQHEREHNQQIRELESEHVTETKNIEQLERQREEILGLFKSAETQFEGKLAEVKRKHREQVAKLVSEFLESVGAQPGDDVRQMVQDLREEVVKQADQISLLAEQLQRKDRSLYEALRAIDALSSQHRNKTVSPVDAGAMTPRRGSLLSRRFSLRNALAQYRRGRDNNEAKPEDDDDNNENSENPRRSSGSTEDDMQRQASLPSALGTISARRNNARRPAGAEELTS